MKFAQTLSTYVGIAAVVCIPLAYLDGLNRFVQLPQVLVLHLVALGGCVAWFMSGQWRKTLLILPASILLLAETLSVFQAQSKIFSILPISTHLAGLFLFLALVNGLTRTSFLLVVRIACIVSAVISLFGLLQFIGVGQDWVPTSGLPSATLGHRNLAAAYLIGLIPLTLWLWWTANEKWPGVGWALVLSLQGAFLLATRSRGAWLGLVVGLGVLLAGVFGSRQRLRLDLRVKREQVLGFVLVGVVLVGVAFLPAQIEKGAGEAMWHGKVNISDAVTSVVTSGGDKSRLILWQHTLSMIAAHPFVGVGAGNWRLMYPIFAQGDLMHPSTVPYRPHNDFLWIWSETGILGAVAFLGLIGLAFWLAWSASNTRNHGLEWCLIGGIVAVVVNGSFGFSRAFPATWFPFWLGLVGLVVCGERRVISWANLRYGIGLGVVVLVLSCWGIIRQIQFDQFFLRTRVAFVEKNWSQVISSANQALRFGRFNEEAFVLRGRAFSEVGQASLAAQDFRAGLSQHPHSVALWNGLGNAQRMQGEIENARKSFVKALEFDPASGEAFNNLGTLYAANGYLDSAQVVYQRALKYAVDLSPVYANLSIVYRKKGQLNEAIESAQKALAIDPTHFEALAANGQALLAAHRYAEAAQAFSQALERAPHHVQFYFSLAQAYEGLGDARGALISYQNFLKQWKGPDVPQVHYAKKRVEAFSSP